MILHEANLKLRSWTPNTDTEIFHNTAWSWWADLSKRY